MSDRESLQNRLYVFPKKQQIAPIMSRGTKRPIVPPLNLTNRIEVPEPVQSARTERNPRLNRIPTARSSMFGSERIPATSRDRSFIPPPWTQNTTCEFSDWKKHKFYTPAILDCEWNDMELPYWYIWQLHCLDVKNEFLYLDYANTPTPNMYCLIPISSSFVNSNHYFTLSIDGITHFVNGIGHFMHIEQWLREVTLFRSVGNVPFFHNFLSLYAFRFLKYSAISRKQSEYSEIVEKKYLLASPYFRIIADDIRKISIELEAVPIVDLKFFKAISLSEFIEKQSIHLRILTDTMKEIQSRARNHLVTACDLAHSASRDIGSQSEASNSLEQFMGQFSKQNKARKNQRLKRGNKREEHAIDGDSQHFTRLATVRSCCKRITKFIRTCDYSLMQALLECVNKSARQFVDFFNSTPPQRCLSIDFIVDRFEPSFENFSSKMGRVWEELSRATSNFERFLYSPDFGIYTQASLQKLDKYREVELAQKFSDVLSMDENYRNTMSELIPNIQKTFDEMKTITETLQPYLSILKQSKELKMDFSDDSSSFFSEMINDLKSQIETVDSMPAQLEHRLFQIDLEKMKESIMPAPRNSINSLRVFIPNLCLKKARSLDEILTTFSDKLNKDVTTVFQFGDQFETFLQLQSNIPKYRKEYHSILDLFSLLGNESFPISPELETMTRGLAPKYSAFESIYLKLSESKDQMIRKWSDMIKKEIGMLSQDIVKQQTTLNLLTDDVSSSLKSIDGIYSIGMKFQKDLDRYQAIQILIGQKPTEIDGLSIFLTDLKNKKTLYTTASSWYESKSIFLESLLKTINAVEFQDSIEKTKQTSDFLSRTFPASKLAAELKQSVTDFFQLAPVISTLRSSALEERHWERIEKILSMKGLQTGELPIQTLVDCGATRFSDEFSQISVEAENEKTLLSMIEDILIEWSTVKFEIISLTDSNVLTLGGLSEITEVLDDSLVKCSTIRGSRYVGPIKLRVDKTIAVLNKVGKIIEYVSSVQKQWLYLKNIFKDSDIQRQLSNDYKIFHEVEKEFKIWVLNVRDKPRVYAIAAQGDEPIKMLMGWDKNLEIIQRAIEAFLMNKRTEFPRFFFLSNDDLIEILSLGKNPVGIQKHLNKIFENIYGLSIVDNGHSIDGIISKETEKVAIQTVAVRGPVEGWLKTLEQQMRRALQLVSAEAFAAYESSSFKEWTSQFPGQTILSITQCYFTQLVNENINGKLDLALAFYEERLKELASMVRTDLNPVYREILVALITLEVHSRDIVQELIKGKIYDHSDFEWTKRLRYYFEDNKLVIRQHDASIEYGYEYLGATSRLIITPLTERCYLTLTTALKHHLGGSPAGPAGTGKTETVKDLAKAIANLCVVFNCSEAVTANQMQSFFSGLSMTGAWSCFDEFNRIDPGVLSVIAEQVRTIQDALNIDAQTFVFCGKNISLNPRCGVFITMNPGYAGRTELPDNLKALFRPIAMTVPDYALIAEIFLYGQGFENARILAEKITQLYKLSSEMLSPQNHYDFGMRALKSVLSMAGLVKRQMPDNPEDEILIQAINNSNIPKLLGNDKTLFQSLVSDLFQDVLFDTILDPVLISKLKTVFLEKGLSMIDSLIVRTVQLHETMRIRHGVMLIGPSGGGKSVSLTTLGSALNANMRFLNPKSIELSKLYGSFNESTGEWFDGIVAKMFRESLSNETKQQQWIIFDGPVDALWIENMNTVLDDNKMLSLANSQRLKMSDEMHLLFEVGDLSQASPATVSRCGMVYYDPSEITWDALCYSWFITSQLNENGKNIVHEFLSNVLSQNSQAGFALTLNSGFRTFSRFLESMITKNKEVLDRDLPDMYEKRIKSVCIWTFAWAFGGYLQNRQRNDFDGFLRDCLTNKYHYPGKYTIFDYLLENDCITFTPWSKYSDAQPPTEQFVSTPDTVCYSNMINMCIENKLHVMLTGPSGSGKSTIALNTLRSIENQVFSFSLTLSAQTSAQQIQETIETKMESKRKTLLGPPEGKSAVFLVDDIIMPKPDTYGSQPPLELLRQYLGYGGFFNRKELTWIEVKNMTIIAAGQPAGGGRAKLSPRFEGAFSQLSIPEPSSHSLKTIFSSILALFFSKNKFHDTVKTLLPSIVDASVAVFERVCSDFLPTPSRSHYTFNLRDLSHVFIGIKSAKTEVIYSPELLVNLWEHENQRIYGDRLVDTSDRNTFQELLTTIKKKSFKIEEDNQNPQIFTDFQSHDGVYRPSLNFKRLRDKLTQFFEERWPSKHLVFFDDAIKHVCRLLRVLRHPSGNMMLVGVGGTGKRTTARAAAAIAEYGFFEPRLTNRYSRTEFREDLKDLYIKCGIEGKSICFLVSDEHIINESFLEDINCILNNGEVPNLFDSDEMEKIVTEMTPVIKKLSLSFARDVILSTFIERVRSHLHIILALSPIGSKFRTRCQMFPSLVNCCTIDWFDTWTDDALTDVALCQLRDIDFSGIPTVDNIHGKIAQAATLSHMAITNASNQMMSEIKRLYFVTPAAYIEFINAFGKLLAKRHHKFEEEQSLLQRGLMKLEETNSVVVTMEQELVALKPQLQEKAVIGQQLLENLERDKKILEETKSIVEEEKIAVQKMADIAGVFAAKAKAERDAILPVLKKAMDTVEILKSKKGELSAVKTYKSPPPRVKLVLSAVCALTGFPTDWKGAQTFLAKPNNMTILSELHNQNISDNDLKKIQPFLQDPEFTEEKVAEQSEAASCLCRWVISIDQYIRVRKEIEPLERKCAEAQASLDEATSKLASKVQELSTLEKSYNELQQKLQKSLEEQEILKGKINRTQIRLENASKLTTALNDEHSRWSQSLEVLTSLAANIVGDTFLIALSLSYIGPFPPLYRINLLEDLRKIVKSVEIPFTLTFNLEAAAGDPMQIRDWRIAGLPSDSLSTENGVLVTQSSRWPLLIDPQEQGFRWFCKINEDNGLQIIRPGEPKIAITIENAIKMGTPVIVEGIGETIDPSLKSVLNPQIRKGPSGNLKIMIDGREIDYDPNFKLILVTKHWNPVFLPDVFIQLSVINFAVTPEGLVEQLLTDVVKLEKPEVEAARAKLVVEIAQNKKLLDQQMKKILNLLFKSEGNILDNEELIIALQSAKSTAKQVSTRLEECEVTEKQNAELCEIYRGVAQRGSILFFTLPNLSSVDPMYQYSLEFFKNLFINCILVPHNTESTEKRLSDLVDLITYRTYCSVSRGLFSRHQIFYSFLLVSSILRGENRIDSDEWDLFVRGPTSLPDEDSVTPPHGSINILTWRKIVSMSNSYKPFEGLSDDISSSFRDYENFFVSERSLDLPKKYGILSSFQRLLLISITAPRKTLLAITEFIVKIYGSKFASPPDLSIPSAYVDTKPSIPLVFVLSQGADPLPALRNFSEKNESKLMPLSLGQGQGPIAVELIKNAKITGAWVFLQNCHLYASWLPTLSDILREIRNKPKDVHQNFRLFLSSMPTPEFPFSVLQESVKVTSEPPRGLALNISRLITNVISPYSFDSSASSQRFVLALAYFASLIQERKKFGPLGWNIIYEWSDSDFRISTLMMRSLMNGNDIQWKALVQLVGQIAFGGRVTDEWDRRCLLSHLTNIISPNLLSNDFSFDNHKLFKLPSQPGYQATLQHILTYPQDDPPDVFGLHLNAQMSAQTQQSSEFLSALQDVQPRVKGGASGNKTDNTVVTIAEKILNEVPGLLVYNEPSIETSLHVVLRQEIIRYNKLLTIVKDSLTNMLNAVKGLVVMNDTLSEMYSSFTVGRVPEYWKSNSYPSMKPLVSWIADLVKRVDFIKTWATKGEPIVFWIGGFFFPQSFMTGVLQSYSRKHKVPVNSLRFKTVIVQQPAYTIKAQPEDGVFISGLFFDGADWDKEQMILTDPQVGTSYSPAPVIQLVPQPNYEMPENDFVCPIYRTQIRAGVLSSTGLSTNFVVGVHLPVKENPTFWILRGAALLLSTPD